MDKDEKKPELLPDIFADMIAADAMGQDVPLLTEPEILKEIERFGFQTGSRVYGVPEPTSDWDYAMNIMDQEYIVALLKKANVLYTEGTYYEKSAYFTLGREQYNVFSVPMANLEAWKTATVAVKAMQDKFERKDKLIWQHLFITIRDMWIFRDDNRR